MTLMKNDKEKRETTFQLIDKTKENVEYVEYVEYVISENTEGAQFVDKIDILTNKVISRIAVND